MRVSLQWLRELVPFRSDVDSLAEQLSMAGFEVEEQDDLAARAAGVVVGGVVAAGIVVSGAVVAAVSVAVVIVAGEKSNRPSGYTLYGL